jgi:hypothetical protein
MDYLCKELFKGKNVILIGPAPYLIGKGRQMELDKGYDTVLRFNNMLSNKNKDDYGGKTDVMFVNRAFYKNEFGPKIDYYNDLYEKNNVKLVITFQDDLNVFDKCGIPIFSLDSEFIHTIVEEVGASPYGGITMSKFISQFNPMGIYLTGMNFYMGDAYYDGYHTKKESQVIHDPLKNIKWIKKNVDSYKIKVDQYMYDILYNSGEGIYYCDACADSNGWRKTAHKVDVACPLCGKKINGKFVNANLGGFLK